MLTDREKAIALLGLRNALCMSGMTLEEVFPRLRSIAEAEGLSLEFLERVREEHQAWLEELGLT